MNLIIKIILSLGAGAGLSILVVWLVALNVKKIIYLKKYQSFSGLIGRLAISAMLIIAIMKYLKPEIFPFFIGFFITYFLTVWVMSIKFF